MYLIQHASLRASFIRHSPDYGPLRTIIRSLGASGNQIRACRKLFVMSARAAREGDMTQLLVMGWVPDAYISIHSWIYTDSARQNSVTNRAGTVLLLRVGRSSPPF